MPSEIRNKRDVVRRIGKMSEEDRVEYLLEQTERIKNGAKHVKWNIVDVLKASKEADHTIEYGTQDYIIRLIEISERMDELSYVLHDDEAYYKDGDFEADPPHTTYNRTYNF